jgi:hypothetical protein
MRRPRVRRTTAVAVTAMAMTALWGVTATGTASYAAAAHPAPVSARLSGAVDGGSTSLARPAHRSTSAHVVTAHQIPRCTHCCASAWELWGDA